MIHYALQSQSLRPTINASLSTYDNKHAIDDVKPPVECSCPERRSIQPDRVRYTGTISLRLLSDPYSAVYLLKYPHNYTVLMVHAAGRDLSMPAAVWQTRWSVRASHTCECSLFTAAGGPFKGLEYTSLSFSC